MSTTRVENHVKTASTADLLNDMQTLSRLIGECNTRRASTMGRVWREDLELTRAEVDRRIAVLTSGGEVEARWLSAPVEGRMARRSPAFPPFV